MSVHNTSPAKMWTAVQPPFTVAQWQELEHQALIFKYLKAGLTVPPDLLVPIRNSLQLMMSHSQQHHFHHLPSLGYYGKKIDPEPGRCRRTDGKKWRCARDAHPDSKYCDRHMIRRRSRKPVESQSQTQSQSSSSTTSSSSQLVAATTGATTAVSAAGTGTFQNLPFCTNGTRQGFTPGNGNISMMEPLPLPTEVGKKEYRFGLNSQADEYNFFQKDLGTVKHLSYDFLSDGPLTHMAQIPPNAVSESRSGSTMVGNCFQQQTMRDADMLNLDYARSKELVFNGQSSSPGCLKQESQSPQPLLTDWPWKKDLSSSAIEYKPNIDFNWNPDVN